MAEQITFYVTGSSGTETVSVPCIPNMANDSNALISGGFESGASLVVVFRTAHFVSADMTEITVDSDLFTADNSLARPRASKKCRFRGKEYRILTAGTDGVGAYNRLVLGDAKAR